LLGFAAVYGVHGTWQPLRMTFVIHSSMIDAAVLSVRRPPETIMSACFAVCAAIRAFSIAAGER